MYSMSSTLPQNSNNYPLYGGGDLPLGKSMCFDLSSYHFDLPDNRIAQIPADPRDSARLMIVDRKTGTICEAFVRDLPEFLSPGDALVFNNTKVLHASLEGRLEDGRVVNCLLTRSERPDAWWVLAKPARKLTCGRKLLFPLGILATVEKENEAERFLRFSRDITPELLEQIGAIPLPPYIRRKATDEDAKRYQTIYGKHYGSVAAPTAGLHCTDAVFARLEERGISHHFVTLHVGTGTFLPIRVQDVRDHHMHRELFSLEPDVAATLNNVKGRRVAVGTTACRVLETTARDDGLLHPGQGATQLFIYPGYRFKYVSALLTNFHTPKSSLLVLVSAFMGYELMRKAYHMAIEKGFRFFSYGDAMLIL